MRAAVHSTKLHGKTLKPGKVVLIPYRQLTLQCRDLRERLFTISSRKISSGQGSESEPEFQAFLLWHDGLPGRFLAQRELVTSVAVILHRLELSLVPFGNTSNSNAKERPPFPKIEEMKPCLGIMGPAKERISGFSFD